MDEKIKIPEILLFGLTGKSKSDCSVKVCITTGHNIFLIEYPDYLIDYFDRDEDLKNLLNTYEVNEILSYERGVYEAELEIITFKCNNFDDPTEYDSIIKIKLKNKCL